MQDRDVSDLGDVGTYRNSGDATPHGSSRMKPCVIVLVAVGSGALSAASPVVAGTIGTGLLEQPWPKQREHTYEVGRVPVRWRQQVRAREGIFAGARFTAPLGRERAWALTGDYSDLGAMTPGVTAVRVLEQTPTRQVIEVDVKVLWKSVRLHFEMEQEPPETLRFRMNTPALGDYLGVARLRPVSSGQTEIELSTWLSPTVRVPRGLVIWVERGAMLGGIRNFLKTCEHASPT